MSGYSLREHCTRLLLKMILPISFFDKIEAERRKTAKGSP
jgi:hypothetical protein